MCTALYYRVRQKKGLSRKSKPLDSGSMSPTNSKMSTGAVRPSVRAAQNKTGFLLRSFLSFPILHHIIK